MDHETLIDEMISDFEIISDGTWKNNYLLVGIIKLICPLGTPETPHFPGTSSKTSYGFQYFSHGPLDKGKSNKRTNRRTSIRSSPQQRLRKRLMQPVPRQMHLRRHMPRTFYSVRDLRRCFRWELTWLCSIRWCIWYCMLCWRLWQFCFSAYRYRASFHHQLQISGLLLDQKSCRHLLQFPEP